MMPTASASLSQLLKKYDVPAPRYTSYPTVPYWSENPQTSDWLREMSLGLAPESSTWSLYIHVPFCETLCTFCGCNTSITKDHSRESPYVDLLLTEWDLYRRAVPELEGKLLRQIHLGGGSPTFLSPRQLSRMVEHLYKHTHRDHSNPDAFEGAIEVDPRRTTVEQLRALRDLGFNRISMGVQDFDPEVQRLVHRIQPRDMTEKLTQSARDMGYSSVNFDLIYGLPKQTPESIRITAEITVELAPDRIALYSFARVPWIKPAQRLFKDEDLPVGQDKRLLYEIAREILLASGYIEIGMDHFAKPQDGLARADREGRLHRNFMGYVDQRTDVLLGLGVSSISEAPGCFHQNEKALPVYERRVKAGEIPTLRGHLLNDEDKRRREQILQLMTRWQVRLENAEQIERVNKLLKPLIEDQLVVLDKDMLKLTPLGRPFLRNACMALDERLHRKAPQTQLFSQAV